MLPVADAGVTFAISVIFPPKILGFEVLRSAKWVGVLALNRAAGMAKSNGPASFKANKMYRLIARVYLGPKIQVERRTTAHGGDGSKRSPAHIPCSAAAKLSRRS